MSFGPSPNWNQFKFGMCRFCFDENEHRKGGMTFGAKYIRIGPVCRHRLLPFARVIPQFKINAIRQERLEERLTK